MRKTPNLFKKSKALTKNSVRSLPFSPPSFPVIIAVETGGNTATKHSVYLRTHSNTHS